MGLTSNAGAYGCYWKGTSSGTGVSKCGGGSTWYCTYWKNNVLIDQGDCSL